MEAVRDKATMEKYSSAFTISDMEVFLFPELMMALVLANIMSGRLWSWKDDPWFAGLEKMTWNRKLQRLKQYIMDHYSFNLDLETWGLTTKEKELARFSPFVEPEVFSRSNALFGYEGDRYYFDMDIRRHFGLDKFTSNVIPYWKTETVEAMDAFQFKQGYHRGAGECVSLAALYAAALFVVLEVPLEDIFLMATPLHSQNFLLVEDGVITNNRRLVTKTMWTNGTELTDKARRALAYERVTIVSHITGYIHIDQQRATMQQAAYQRFKWHLQAYLTSGLTFELFINFLRVHGKYRRYFQFEYQHQGHSYYITAEDLFCYEHGSKNRIGDSTRKKLLEEVETEDFELQAYRRRFILNVLETSLNGQALSCQDGNLHSFLEDALAGFPALEEMEKDLCSFIHLEPQLPAEDKLFIAEPELVLSPAMGREGIIAYLQQQRSRHETANLAFYAGRQLDEKGWPPFLKACWERNPVSRLRFQDMSPEAVYAALQAWPHVSIYDDQGLATPDEVVNFERGDGLEKALLLANVLLARALQPGSLSIRGTRVLVVWGDRQFEFESSKGYQLQWPLPAALHQPTGAKEKE